MTKFWVITRTECMDIQGAFTGFNSTKSIVTHKGEPIDDDLEAVFQQMEDIDDGRAD